MASFRTLQSSNRRKTIGLLLGFGALLWVVSYAAMSYFGATGIGVIPIAVAISLISVWGSYYASDKLVLTMTGARVIQESDNPRLFDLVQEVLGPSDAEGCDRRRSSAECFRYRTRS